MLNEKEIEFINSINNKIAFYSIPVTAKEVLSNASGTFVETTYSDKTTEIVDVGVEWFICSKSPYYFIQRYCYISVPNMGIIPFDLYYFQKEILKEINQYKKLVFLKTRQCLTEDNFVMTNRGYISIKDVKIGDSIETIVNGKSTFVGVSDSFYTGKREVCRILTNSGLTIDCTLDHKVFTKRGWIEAGDLTIKDEIVSIIDKGAFGDFKLDNNKFAALIGYYLADGRYSSPSFVNTNIEYANEVLEAGKLFENCEPYIHTRKDTRNRKQAYDVRLVSKSKANNIDRPIRDFMARFGLDVPSSSRCLTKELMNLNEEQMSILINRLYAGDGWITYKKDKRRPNYIQYEIGIGSPCYELIKQLEYILQTKYSIRCYISECFDKRNPNGKRFWKLRIAQKKSVLNFVSKIGIKGKTDTQEIIDVLSKEEPYDTKQSFEKVRKITHKEELYDVYDITTDSSSFLTNGLLVHNCGISTVTSFYCLWRALFRSSESIAIVSKRKDAAQDFISKMKVTLDLLPHFLRQKIISDNKSSIKFANESEIKSEARSPNAGRSATLSLLVLDEAAFYGSAEMAKQIVASAMPTLTRTGGSLFVISTPSGQYGQGQYYFEQCQQMLMQGNTKTEKLVEIDWFEVPDMPNIYPQKGYNHILQKYIGKNYYNDSEARKELKALFKPIQDNWKNNQWLKTQHDVLGEALFRQEILHDFVTMGSSVFNNDLLVRVSTKIKDPIMKNTLGNSSYDGLWIWKAPIPGKRYILCADVSSGTSSDFSTIQVLDVEAYEQVCEYHGHISTPNFGVLLKKVANYYNQAYLVVESNSIGEAVFNAIYYDDNDPYKNVFKQEKTKNNITRMTGWITDVKTRKLIVNEMIDWISVDELFNSLKIYSSRLYTELTTWVWKENGKAEHSEGAHDDLIIAFALALYNRNKAISTGNSFIIDENGKIISATASGKDASAVTEKNVFYGIVMDGLNDGEDDIDSMLSERFNTSLDQYKWLSGQ